MDEHLREKAEAIRKSAEIILEHEQSRMVISRSGLIEVAAKNIIALVEDLVQEIEKALKSQ